ncbi:MAG: GNAT family N-acetyltransferase [Planctomycetaceae bacterium]|nr:GNAT family N-acetyltransferase [Planctomycetaceae bacterium]
MNFDILRIQSQYLKQVVDIHIKAFPEFFLTFLGPAFLRQFYKSFMEDNAGIGFVAIDIQTKQVIGAVVGPLAPQGYFKRLLKRKWWAFCMASLAAVIKKPNVIGRLFRAVFYRGDTSGHAEGLALLSSIAVSPDVQTKGIGAALVHAFTKEVKQRGGKGVFLTTDTDNNYKVNRFYQRLGFSLDSSYTTPEGRKMNHYTLIFSGSDSRKVQPHGE